MSYGIERSEERDERWRIDVSWFRGDEGGGKGEESGGEKKHMEHNLLQRAQQQKKVEKADGRAYVSTRYTSPVGIVAEDGHVGIGLGLVWREKFCSLEGGFGFLQSQRRKHEIPLDWRDIGTGKRLHNER
jgi:hypothetical protein